jgi:hypothetical protein
VEAPQPRTEADEELCRLHAGRPGGDEVAELVEEDGDEDPEGEQQHPAVGEAEPDEQADDSQAGDDPSGAPAERLTGGVALGDAAACHDLAAEALVPTVGGRRRKRPGSSSRVWAVPRDLVWLVRLHRMSQPLR